MSQYKAPKKFFFNILLISLFFIQLKSKAQGISKNEILANAEAPLFAKMTVDTNANYFEIIEAYERYKKSLNPKKIIKKEGEEVEYTDRWVFYFERWNAHKRPYVKTDGKIGNVNDSSIVQYLAERNTYTQNKTDALGWRLVGPTIALEENGDTANTTGNIYCITFNTSNPNIGYCGTESGYIFKTIDKGENWTLMGKNFIFPGGIRGIATHHTNANIVYAGSGNNLFKSIDGGTNWSSIASGFGAIYTLVLNPQNSASIILGSDNGVYQSFDNGQTFVQRLSGKANAVRYKPNDTTTLLAYCTQSVATSTYPSGNYNAYAWKSINGGLTFVKKPNGWYNYLSNRKYTYFTGDLNFSTSNPNIVYVLLAGVESDPTNTNNDNTGDFGILISNDAGENWSFKKGPWTYPNLMTFGFASNDYNNTYFQGDYNNWLVINPQNPSQVFVGALTGYRSTDSGATWTKTTGYSGIFSSHPDHQNLYLQGNTLWICNDGGILKSNDFLASQPISKARGLHAGQFWGLGTGWNQEIVTGGLYHNGNLASNLSTFPSKTFLSLGGGESATGYVSPYENKVYHSDISAYSLPTTLPGQLQSLVNLAMFPNESYGTSSSDVIYDPQNTKTLFLGNSKNLMKSVNNGVSFQSIYSFSNDIIDISIPLNGADTLYVSTKNDNKVWVSTNGGSTFSNISATLSNGEKNIIVNHFNPKEVFVLPKGSSNIYKSTNLGSTWTNIGGGNLIGKNTATMLIQAHPTDATCYIFCHNGGVYYKNQSTAGAWNPLIQDLPAQIYLRKVSPFYYKNKMFMALDGLSIWEHDFVGPKAVLANFASDKSTLDCNQDTVYFYDHSIVDESGGTVTRQWNFPGASFIGGTNQNPKVLYSTLGNYDVSLTVNDGNGNINTKTIQNYISMTQNICSIDTTPGLAISTNTTNTSSIDIGKVNLHNSTNFSVSFWVKPHGMQKSFSQIISSNSPNTYFGIGFAFDGYTPNLNLIFSENGVPYGINSTIYLDDNKWNYITLVYTPNQVSIYKNGELPGWTYTKVGSNISFDLGSVYINSDIHNQNGDFKGDVDEVAFYNKALSIQEIREKMHLCKKANELNLVKYIQFNQYSSINNLVYDAIGAQAISVSSDNILPSSVPVAAGKVFSINNINSGGNYVFTNLDMNITLGNNPPYPNGTLVGFKLNYTPDSKPTTDSTFPRKTYWIVNNYGTNSTFSALTNMKFTGLTKISPYNYTQKEFQLYKRNSIADGATWGALQDSCDAVVVNSNSIDLMFSTQNNITSFGQFCINTNNSQTLSNHFLVENKMPILVFPNPAEKWVNLEFESIETKGNITIYDLNGRIARNYANLELKKGKNRLMLNIQNLPAGEFIGILNYDVNQKFKLQIQD